MKASVEVFQWKSSSGSPPAEDLAWKFSSYYVALRTLKKRPPVDDHKYVVQAGVLENLVEHTVLVQLVSVWNIVYFHHRCFDRLFRLRENTVLAEINNIPLEPLDIILSKM